MLFWPDPLVTAATQLTKTAGQVLLPAGLSARMFSLTSRLDSAPHYFKFLLKRDLLRLISPHPRSKQTNLVPRYKLCMFLEPAFFPQDWLLPDIYLSLYFLTKLHSTKQHWIKQHLERTLVYLIHCFMLGVWKNYLPVRHFNNVSGFAWCYHMPVQNMSPWEFIDTD